MANGVSIGRGDNCIELAVPEITHRYIIILAHTLGYTYILSEQLAQSNFKKQLTGK